MLSFATGTSSIWNGFKHVTLDEKDVEFVVCLSCMHVITFKKKDGTKGMHAHRCSADDKPALQCKITAFVEKSTLPQQATQQLKNDLIKFVATDIRPFSAVAGSGFQSLCQTLVNLGARYGQFDVKEAIPDRTTLARNVPSYVEQTKDVVRKKLAASEHIAVTSDGWTDDFRKVSYVTVTAHFLDNDLNLHSCILNTGSVAAKKTAEVLGNVVSEVVADFGFEMTKVTIVTDNASNMVAAFRDRCWRLSCFAHCLNLVVTEMLATDNGDFQMMLTTCKNLVRHFKHTGLQQKLEKTLKQECPTWWNSTYSMLESVLGQYDAVQAILIQRKEIKYLCAVDKDLMADVLSLLTHFKAASETACSEKKPTLHLVAPLYHRLMSICAPVDTDSAVIRELKVKGRQALLSKVRLDPLHDVASFLNPCMKALTFVTPARKKTALETVNKMISELENGNCSDGLNSCDRSTEDEEVFVNCNIACEV